MEQIKSLISAKRYLSPLASSVDETPVGFWLDLSADH